MNFITREQARRNIVDLGLPQIVLDAFDEKPLPYNLDIAFHFPYQILDHEADKQASCGDGPITPIWTGGGDYMIVAYHHDPARQGYFRFDIETGDDDEPVGMNWQQVLVKEFKFFWESEMPDDWLREVANLFAFRYVEQLIIELPQAKLDTFEKDAVWYQLFLQRIRG